MVLKFVLLAVLIGVAFAITSRNHHSHGYQGEGQHGYQVGHHGYHGGDHGYGYYAGHHGHGYFGRHYGHGYRNHHDNLDYKFKYDVKDDKTYNYQSRDEYKDGKNVYGSYSLGQPDGKLNVVKYKVDGYGFQADVDYKGNYKTTKPSYGHHDHY